MRMIIELQRDSIRKSIEIIQTIYPNYQPPIIYNLLNHSIFSQSPSLISSKGIIIASWNILIETKNELIPILQLTVLVMKLK